MKLIFAGLLILSVIGLPSCASYHSETTSAGNATDAELVITSGTSNRTVSLVEMSRSLPVQKLVVDDPVYNKRKRYEGFWLEDVLRLASVKLAPSTMLVFSCLDGYQARLPRIPEPPARGLLAVRDLDQKQGWESFVSGKEKSTPAPFYLVWRQDTGADERTRSTNSSLPWPYQLNRIEVRDAVDAQRRLLPPASNVSSNVWRGFNLFTAHCVACHSVNLEGGALGPELNIPKNITEYRDWEYLKEFIRAPGSFRARSKMPDFGAQLSDTDIDDILSYLQEMRNHKMPARESNRSKRREQRFEPRMDANQREFGMAAKRSKRRKIQQMRRRTAFARKLWRDKSTRQAEGNEN